jgi:Flp pilus assembly protein TadB
MRDVSEKPRFAQVVLGASLPYDSVDASFDRLTQIEAGSAGDSDSHQKQTDEFETELSRFRGRLVLEEEYTARFTWLSATGSLLAIAVGVYAFFLESVKISALVTVVSLIASTISATIAYVSYRQSKRRRFLTQVVEKRMQLLEETIGLSSSVR